MPWKRDEQVHIRFRLSPELHEEFMALATLDGRSMNGILNDLVWKYVQEGEKDG